MATVFRARQLSISRYVALKIIDLSTNQDEREEFRKRFEQESKVITMLEHIHILPVYGYGTIEDECAYIAMRMLRGGSLADLLRKGPLPLHRAFDIFSQIARGLQYAHTRGVIHRDIKPSNILLDDAGNAYLSDFGLAKMVGSERDLTRSGNLVGTPAYVAPELVRGEPADHRSDIYSLGILLYHMLTGQPPFQLTETGVAALLYKHVEEPPPPPRLLNDTVTAEIELIVLRALEKDPNSRYQSVDDFLEDLDNATGRRHTGRSFVRLPTPEGLRLLRRVRKRLSARLVIIMAIGIALVGVAMIVIYPQDAPAEQHVIIEAGETGTAADVMPSEAEITAARANLNSSRFIAFLACRLDNVSSAARARAMSVVAESMQLGFRIYDAQNDVYTQLTQLEQARAEGAHAIILCPLDPASLIDAVNRLEADSVPLTFITIYDHPYGVKLDSNSFEIGLQIGRLGGQFFQDGKMGTARVVLLGDSEASAIERRLDGMEAGFKEMVPEALIVGRYPGTSQEPSYQSIQQLIESNTEFNVILAVRDASAYGAIQAMQEADFDPESIIVVSANGEDYAQQLIRTGTFLRGTVAVNIEESGRLAIYASIKMLAGSEVPEFLTYSGGEILTRAVLAARGN
jgi:ABC-type sugar transport system substrate-binding protein